MTIWAIVPVKPLRLGKSRLSGTLSEDERSVLNRTLLERTLVTLKETPEITQILVVSRDPAALAVAREYGTHTILEDGNPDLNRALTRATLLARPRATRGVLIIPADLPTLEREDLEQFIDHIHEPPCVVIAPDRHEDGTNMLLVAPGGLISYDYGPGSFNRHVAHALNAGAHLEVVHNDHLALDLDLPEDLILMRQVENARL